MPKFAGLHGGDVLTPILETVLDAVVVIDQAGTIIGWSDHAEEAFGWARAEAVGQLLETLIIPAQHRSAHAAGLKHVEAGGKPRVLNRRIEITALRKDGEEIPIELAITETRGANGKVYVGFLRDISERRKNEATLARQANETRLIFRIATMASEAASFEDALEAALKGICDISGWPVGHAFLAPDPGHQLISSDIWIEDRPGRADRLKKATRDSTFVTGRGMPGSILSTNEPVWVADTDEETNFIRKGLGFHGAFGFPLKVAGNVIAVLEFFSDSPQEPDPDLILTVRTLGEQVGRVLERKRTEDRQKLLLGELNHRVKNTMAVVRGIVRQSFKSARSLEGAEEALLDRLDTVASAHELLTAERWTRASMRDIIRSATEGCGTGGDKVSITGQDFNVRAETAVNIALAIHELCTNAFKYGALSVPEGRVEISWNLNEAVPPKFRFQWVEKGGPPVEPPKHSGFGSKILRIGFGAELAGDVKMDFAPEGLRMTYEASLRRPAPPPGP